MLISVLLGLPSSQAGYFRLDDINAKLKEQLRVESERANELQEEVERLRHSTTASRQSSSVETQSQQREIERLQEQLRQARRERDEALRSSGTSASKAADPDVFEPGRSGAPTGF